MCTPIPSVMRVGWAGILDMSWNHRLVSSVSGGNFEQSGFYK
jgi:hypothetical protein